MHSHTLTNTRTCLSQGRWDLGSSVPYNIPGIGPSATAVVSLGCWLPGPSRKTRTKDKYRVVYTDHQRLELEKEFQYNRYIMKLLLATTYWLPVKIWFQNRRAKERKMTRKKLQHSQQASTTTPTPPVSFFYYIGYTYIHSSSLPFIPFRGHGVSGAYPGHLGESKGCPGLVTSLSQGKISSITHPFVLTLTVYLELPINL
uniref:Caudal type homeobox 1a n=1 Tax=Oryzias latipes TaxID=8090 RepID=A0A3B3HPB8_ORYLA